MNTVLFRHILGSYRGRFLVCCAAIGAWGLILPVVYSAFGKTLADALASMPAFAQLTQFGGGDLISLSGAISLGFIHPFSVALLSVFAIGYPLTALAGERQRGTLEVLLARPISRRTLYVTTFAAGVVFIGIMQAIELTANAIASVATNAQADFPFANLPLLWLNGWLLFVVFVAVALAASASFDRIGPAAGVALAVLLVSYVIDVVASLWPDAKWIDAYSLFSYVHAKRVLMGTLAIGDVAVLGAIIAIAVGIALYVFPRRDIAAPS